MLPGEDPGAQPLCPSTPRNAREPDFLSVYINPAHPHWNNHGKSGFVQAGAFQPSGCGGIWHKPLSTRRGTRCSADNFLLKTQVRSVGFRDGKFCTVATKSHKISEENIYLFTGDTVGGRYSSDTWGRCSLFYFSIPSATTWDPAAAQRDRWFLQPPSWAHVISPWDLKDKREPLLHRYTKLTCFSVPVRFRWIIEFLFVFGSKQSFSSLGWLPEEGVCGRVLLLGLRASVLINREVT